uniref:Dienelactone hydrolase n=1 Tax=Cyanothece sp. (strain PCC 7425 / ATCC 29141) TaxID=395961 RepID=B8HJQ6_CYAP4
MDIPQHCEEFPVSVLAGSVTLAGDLVLPEDAAGMVLFAHGSGSSRFSPRNRFVAHILQQAGLATLLLDLLTPQEEAVDLRTTRLRFDIQLLAERVVGAVEWLKHKPATQSLRIGLFGASTGAGAALVAAAERPELIHAVVSRGGRPDLAGSALARVQAPTLLIVGGQDHPVIEMNQQALLQIPAEKRLDIVPGTTHLFEEHGTLEQVARLATQWFCQYLAPTRPQRIIA